MLHEAVNSGSTKSWCGPTVVASITGRDVERIKALIKQHRGHNGPVKGTWWPELHHALRCFGYREDSRMVYEKSNRPTLANWLRTHKRDPKAYYVVQVTGHFVVVHGRKLCDTATKGKPVFIRRAPGRRARVWRVFVVKRR